MLIAVIGASGDVGLASVKALLSLGMDHLRLGGRDQHKGAHCLEQLRQQWPHARVQWVAVDFTDPASLVAFTQGCDLVLNCAGPSWQVQDLAAQAARRAEAHYVDAAGDIPLVPAQWHSRCAVRGAGLQPGLTGLLPRWLALQSPPHAQELTSYFGLRDRFTAVAADDFLQGAMDGSSEALAAWRNGRHSRALTRRRDVKLPCFPGSSHVLPYLNQEGEQLATDLHLVRGQWFNVIGDGQVFRTLEQTHALPRAEAVQRLCEASLLDLSGQHPFVTLLLQLDGEQNTEPWTRSLVFCGSANAALTGAMAAATVASVIAGEIATGCHDAARALPPATSLERLLATAAIRSMDLLNAPLDELNTAEEGCL